VMANGGTSHLDTSNIVRHSIVHTIDVGENHVEGFDKGGTCFTCWQTRVYL
jgi:hypothetical protein